MKTFLAIFFSAIFSAMGSNWFVVPGGSGSKSGQSWANAWSADGIRNVGPGDIVWFAGGSYSESFNMAQTSGSAGNPITYQKVISSDPASVTTSVAGWQSSFGTSNCIFPGGPGGLNGNNGYVSFNGRVPGGFSWPNVPLYFGGANFNGSNVTNLSFQYCTFIGPGWNANVNATGPSQCLVFYAGANHYIGHCVFNGMNGGITMDADNSIIEYNQFLNCSGNTSAHPDMIYASGIAGATIRYNYFYQSIGEAVFFDFGSSGPIYFYGNVADCGPLGSGAFLEHKPGYTWSTFYIYNNTFVGNWNEAVFLRGNSNSNPDVVENNLFWNCSSAVESPEPNPISDYNGYNTGIPSYDGSHSVNNTTNPFVDVTDASISPQNFQPSSSSVWPIGNATDLGSPYDNDMNGNSLASTIGAFAFANGSPGSTPLAPTGLRVTVTP